jgi:hypothetical protein
MAKAKKTRVRSKSIMWTKEMINILIELWESRPAKDIAAELGKDVTPIQVSYMANQMRKAGYPLPRKHTRGILQGLILEVAAERGIRLAKKK